MEGKILILELKDIPAEQPYQSEDSFRTILPEHYHEKLKNLVEEMEAELGKSYFIFVRQQNKSTTEFYPVEERKRNYKVVMKDDRCIALNGVYSSISDIKDKIKELTVIDIMSQDCPSSIVYDTLFGPSKYPRAEKIRDQYVWKCPQCNCYGVKSQNSERTWTSINEYQTDRHSCSRCSNCRYDPKFPDSVWARIEIYPESGIVGTCSGGSVSRIKELGTLEII